MNLHEPESLRKFLKRHGLVATKGLGQHFLCSARAVEAIQKALAGCEGLLEIGPGPGVLTAPLSHSAQVIALEVDDRMIAALAESAPKADVRRLDALKAPLDDILAELPTPRGVVSNLPYYITGPLLTRIAEARGSFSRAVLMMQREVANRVLAKPGNRERGSLSVYLQSQFEIARVADVPAGAFLPPPKVDSTILSFTPSPLPVDEERSAEFFRMVRMSFAQPRKTLANNLMAGFHLDRDVATQWVEDAELDETIRPHDLTLDQWVSLFGRMPSPNRT